ncbi:methyl-accepting chemotaxis protein [Marinobacter piscensis]|uniref:methyl-accepting chemotaxis protein n=1 Tax=Marinobacter piscensis TaxID=1562308 RepID=UPI001FE47C5E|nr:methyl-accepting chemotaxis protein [Marinobacter piscensis]
MRKMINNLPMLGKLTFLVLPALLVIIYFAAESVTASLKQLNNMRQLDALVELADISDPLIESLQVERGRSAVFLSSDSGREGGQQASQALNNQRRQTDTQLSDYRTRIARLTQETRFSAPVSNRIQSLKRELATVDRVRNSVDSRSVDSYEAGGLYTTLITGLLDQIPLILARSTDPGLTRSMGAYYALAEAAEAAGKERAAGASLISSKEFDLPSIQTTASFGGQQQAFFRQADAMLSGRSGLREELANLADSRESRNLEAMRKTLFSSQSGMYALDSNEWFDITTQRLQTLNNVRETLLDSTSAVAMQNVAAGRSNLFVASGIAGIAIIIVLSLMIIIARAINVQINSLLQSVRFAMDNKDLTQHVRLNSKDEIGNIGRAINELFMRFSSALLHIDKASVQLATATEETSSTADQNVAQTRSQQSEVEQIAAATEEMSATSEQISENTQQVADAANSVMERSQTGEKVLQNSVTSIHSLASSVKNVNEVIDELEVRSGSIVEVMDVIRKVADQTNLLALNAAIEAARAGEHGRGFAVVADEVRTLARQTHDSTTQIEDIITGLQSITKNASSSITASHELASETIEQTGELEQAFSAILGDVNSISDMASQIATATEEQVAVTRELAGNMESVSEAATLTLTGSQEISHVTGEQAKLARQLQDLANEFRVQEPQSDHS